jgi:hypothetical protein
MDTTRMVQVTWTPGCFLEKNPEGLFFFNREDFADEMEKKFSESCVHRVPENRVTGRIESVEMWPRVYNPAAKQTDDLVIMHMSDEASARKLILTHRSITLGRTVGGIRSFIGVSFCKVKHDLSKLQTYKDVGYFMDLLHATNLEMKAIGAVCPKNGSMCPQFPYTWVDAEAYVAEHKRLQDTDRTGQAAEAFLLGHRPVVNLKGKQSRVDALFKHKIACVWKLRQFQIEGVPFEFEHSD